MLSGAILFAQNISEQLFNLPHVIFKKIETPLNYEAAYELKIKQALDHENLKKDISIRGPT